MIIRDGSQCPLTHAVKDVINVQPISDIAKQTALSCGSPTPRRGGDRGGVTNKR